jgi:hypothetical protein
MFGKGITCKKIVFLIQQLPNKINNRELSNEKKIGASAMLHGP